MNAKDKIEELLEASEGGTITAAQVTKAGLHRSILQELVKNGASGVVYMCGAVHGRMISTSCSASMGAEFTRTIPPCIC